jgi:hypothetical protein
VQNQRTLLGRVSLLFLPFDEAAHRHAYRVDPAREPRAKVLVARPYPVQILSAEDEAPPRGRFQNMAEVAGVQGRDRGLVLTRLSSERRAGLS